MPRLVSDPTVEGLSDGDRIVAEITDALADSRLDVRAIVATVTNALSRLKAGTWVTDLMNQDPSTSLVVAADINEPALAHYVDRYVASTHSPGRAPTMGLSQQVIESGSAILLPSLPYDEFVSMLTSEERTFIGENPLPVGVTSLGLLIVPMRAHGAILGTIGLFHRGVQPLTQNDAIWLQEVADRTGVAVENAQLYEDAIRRLGRLSSLQSINRAIASSSDIRFTLKVILDQVTAKLDVSAADVLLLDSRDRTLSIAASTGFVSTSMPDYEWPMDEGLPGQAITKRRVEMTSATDPAAHARRRSLFAREGFEAYIAVPLMMQGKAVGVIEVFHRSALNPDDEWLAFLDAIGSVSAIAIDIAAANERIKSAGSGPRAAQGMPLPEMTKVERQILGMLVAGSTNREIAGQIHLSQNTVKFHVRRLLEKSQTGNRTELARKATQEGWL